ncbi:speriolin-like protein isoform X1 [Sceloporus undulatus]|uniref:speriolin-like protein isoform X1 n=1 Tax=Sceloporus undulatus TaxID=8520 RepID=UPI001C4CA506|nr:speriolin-like protein isoform X1 [Sceloporus undulatus]
MTEEREWMKRIQEENVHLKNQIRLLKENYELRLLLGQQCNNSNQVQLSAPHVSSTYPDMGSLLKGAQYTGREHLNYPPHLISKDTTNLSCPSAQTQMKRLHNDPTFFHPRGGEKKATHLSSMSCSTIGGKQFEEPANISQLKKAWVTDGAFSEGEKAQNSLSLTIAHYKAGRLLGHSPSWPEELASSRMTNASNKEDILTQASFPDDLKIYKGGSSSRISERQPHHLLSSTQESSKEKTQPEPQEMLRKKRVSFSDEPDSDKLKKFHTFYLNDIELAQNNKRNGRIVGEIAFQLDRRILAHVFPGITRLYGFTVSNIPEKIKQVSMKSLDGSVDEKKYRSMTQRYLDLTTRLEKMGYHKEFHPVFSEFLINTYGILKQRPDLSSNPMHNNPADLRKVVIDIVPSKFLGDTLLLLNCLCELSKEDNKALFAW